MVMLVCMCKDMFVVRYNIYHCTTINIHKFHGQIINKADFREKKGIVV